MPLTTTNIAESIATYLSSYNAQVEIVPDFELRDLKTRKVVVVPVGVQLKTVTRGKTEIRHHIQVGVLKKSEKENVPALIDFVTNLSHQLLNRTFGNAICTEVSLNPMYVAEYLREQGQFTGVLDLYCLEFV